MGRLAQETPETPSRPATFSEKIPTLVFLGGGGAGLLYLSGKVDQPYRGLATLGGLGALIGAGAYFFFAKKTVSPGEPTPAPPPSLPSAIEYEPPTMAEFSAIQGEILAPSDFQTVGAEKGFLRTTPTYPVRYQIYNPTSKDLGVTVELEASELPTYVPFGTEGAEEKVSFVEEKILRAKNVLTVPVEMPVETAYLGVDFADVVLTLNVRGGPGQFRMLDQKVFVVE